MTSVSHSTHDRLKGILQRRVLVVGTTGDNAPFSTLEKSGNYSGIDIDLSRSLAEALDVRVEYIRTSWPTVMTDLHGNMFDIGMSGVVFSIERARSAAFSEPHVLTQKSYLIRATDKQRFSSNADIDVKGVRVGTNNGGTNEKFLREHIKHATVSTVQGRNFEEQLTRQLRNNELDAWLVDTPPGLVLTRLETDLYVMEEPALPIRYAFLLHQGDLTFLNFVNLWLGQLKLTGLLERLQYRAVSRPE